jgi:hypothetical protein
MSERTMTTATIDPQLKQALQTRRSDEFHLLVRVDQVDAGREQALSARGVIVRRSMTLTPTFAVACSGAAGLSLLELPWVHRIEEDRPVYAL